MAPPTTDTRARQSDRDVVVDALSGAFVDGQLTPAEHDKRVSSALRARRVGTLGTLLSDIQLPAGHAAGELVLRAAPSTVQSPVSTPTVRPTPVQPTSGQGKVYILGLVVAFAALCGWAIIDNSQEAAPPAPELFSVAGIEELVADVEGEFGTTQVLSVEASESSVTVLVPSDTGGGRYERYSYRSDYGFSPGLGGSLGANDVDLVDLGELDAQALVDNIEDARTDLGVVDVSEVTVAVADAYWSTTFAREFGDGDIPAHVGIEVSNEFMESAWLATDLAGDEVLGSQSFLPAK